jgi:hypothetical protein
MRAAVLLGCTLVLAALPEIGQCQYPQGLDDSIASVVNSSQPAAPPALNTLRRAVNAGNFRAMGFDALSDTGQTTLGSPLVIFLVGFSDLRPFRPGKNPWEILRPSGRIFYPVLVRGQPRSAIILVRDKNRWRGASYGGANGARLSSNAISAANRGVRRYFWVDVLVPRTGFIGFEDAKRLILIPLRDDRQKRWRAGVPIPAEAVFAELAKEAGRYDNVPG